MTDIQHNISDDHIIKNTTDIGNDYKFSSHNISLDSICGIEGLMFSGNVANTVPTLNN